MIIGNENSHMSIVVGGPVAPEVAGA
jgi:hypothetical protein